MGRVKIALAVVVALVATLAAPIEPAGAALVHRGSIGGPGAGPGELRQPSGVAFSPSGDVWVADTGNGRIQRFTPTGALAETLGGFTSPTGVAVAADDSVYVADAAAGRIVRVLADGSFDSGFRSDGWDDPRALAVDPRGDALYVVEQAPGRVRTVDARTGAIVAEVEAGLLQPAGVAVDAAGAVAITEAAADRVIVRGQRGERIVIGGSGSAAGQFSRPVGVAFDAYGQLLVADSGNGRVQRFSQTGALVDMLEGFATPTGVGADGVQGFAVAEAATDRVSLLDDVLPPPELGRTTNAAPLSGTVTFTPPDGRPQALTAPVQLPFGTELDTSRGLVRLVTARAGGGTQPATLSEGRFVTRQPRSTGVPEALLSGRLGRCAGSAPRPRATAASMLARSAPAGFKPTRVVHTKVKGRYRTVGRAATGSVQGTEYEVADACAGTLVTVFEGAVRVTARGGSGSRVVRPSGGRPGVAFVPFSPRRPRRSG